MTEDVRHVPGWIGTMGQLRWTLSVVGADRDDEGRFILQGEVVTFLGLAGDNAETIVHGEAVYFVSGRPAGLAALLNSTSYGHAVTVI